MSICKNTLNSNEYVEYILRDGPFTRKELDRVEDYCIYEVNNKWIIGSFDNSRIGSFTYESLEYAFLPKLYGLCDLSANNASGVLTVREQPVLNLSGLNVSIAIIDTGINWRHPAFVRKDGRSKIDILFDQQTGRVFYNDEITQALKESDADIPGDEIGHGTAMAGIAVGNLDESAGFSGVAEDAALIVVKLSPAKQYLRNIYFVSTSVPAYSEVDVMRAVAWVSEYVTKNSRLVSYVLGIGSSLGFHTGLSPLGDVLKDESEIAGRCVTLPAGNEGNARLHYAGNVDANSMDYFEIRVGPGENGLTFEIWSFAPEVYELEIISPSGQIANRLPVGSGKSTITNFIFENTLVEVYYLQNEDISGQNLIAVRMDNAASGVWRFNVYARGDFKGQYFVWIMNKSFLQGDTYILTPNPNTTVLNPGNIQNCICVGAYNHRESSISIEASRGYNSFGIIKPDLVAPGVDIITTSNTGDGYIAVSGSSAAAALFAGIAALLLQYGAERLIPDYYKTYEIRNICIAGAIRKTGIVYPNREWGYGAVNLYNSLELLRRG